RHVSEARLAARGVLVYLDGKREAVLLRLLVLERLDLLGDLAVGLVLPTVGVLLAPELVQDVQAPHGERGRARRGEVRLHRRERARHHHPHVAGVAHRDRHLFVARLEQAVAEALGRAFLQALLRLAADVLEAVSLRVPVVHRQLEAVYLLDAVLIGELGHVAQNVARQPDALDLDLVARDVEAALAPRLLGERDDRHLFLSASFGPRSGAGRLADRRQGQERARHGAARVGDLVGVGDAPPLARLLVVARRDRRERLAPLEYPPLRAVGRVRVLQAQLLFERLVLAQNDRERRAQRHAFGTEERELLLDALDDALEGVAPLVAELRRNLAARKVPQPDELADGRRVAVGHDLDEAVNLVGV